MTESESLISSVSAKYWDFRLRAMTQGYSPQEEIEYWAKVFRGMTGEEKAYYLRNYVLGKTQPEVRGNSNLPVDNHKQSASSGLAELMRRRTAEEQQKT